MSSEIKEYGIVLFVDDLATKQAVKFNQQIAAKFPDMVNAPNHWHVTLYHGAFATSDLAEIFNKLKSLPIEAIELNLSSIIMDKKGYILWDVSKNRFCKPT